MATFNTPGVGIPLLTFINGQFIDQFSLIATAGISCVRFDLKCQDFLCILESLKFLVIIWSPKILNLFDIFLPSLLENFGIPELQTDIQVLCVNSTVCFCNWVFCSNKERTSSK